MKESECKKLESKYNSLKNEIQMLANTDESALMDAKLALDKINSAFADAQGLNHTVKALKTRVEK